MTYYTISYYNLLYYNIIHRWPLGFPSGIICQNWNDTEKISMAPAQGWHAQIEKWYRQQKHREKGDREKWAVPFIPIPLPEKIIQTSSCTILLYNVVLQTGLGMGMGVNGTAQERETQRRRGGEVERWTERQRGRRADWQTETDRQMDGWRVCQS